MQNFQQTNQSTSNTKNIISVISVGTLIFSLLFCCYLISFIVGFLFAQQKIKNDFYGKTLKNIDANKEIVLIDDKNFVYYFDEDNPKSYVKGIYSIYFNNSAVNYVANNLPEYGLTIEVQETFNFGYGEYKDYVCLVFEAKNVYENDFEILDFEEEINKENIMTYIGYTTESEDKFYYDLFNLNYWEYETFIQK